MSVLLNLARRNVQRAWRQQILVVILIAVPVGLGIFSAIAERSAHLSSDQIFAEEFGSSAFGLTVDSSDSDATVAVLSEAGAETLVNRRNVMRPGFTSVTDVDLESPLAQGLITDVDGRIPERLGEVALSHRAAESIGVGIGQQLPAMFGGPTTVVGLVEPLNDGHQVIYLPAGSLASAAHQTQGRSATQPSESGERRVAIGVSGIDRQEIESLVGPFGGRGQPWLVAPGDVGGGEGVVGAGMGAFVAAALLVEAALLAAAAFAIRGRRRVVEFGRLSAIGADPGQIRRLVLVEAVVIALVGAALGTLIAVGWAVAAPGHAGALLSFVFGDPETVTAVRLRPLDWIWPPALAVVAALAAAALPARAAGRLSATRALASGGGEDAPVPGNLRSSLAVAAVGFGLIAFAASEGGGQLSGSTVVIVAFAGVVSLALAVAGVASVALVWLDQRLANHLPISLRLALRDSARHRVRSVMALTASGLIIGVVVTGMTLAAEGNRIAYGDGASLARIDASPAWIDVADPSAAPPTQAEGARRLGIDRQLALRTVGDGFDERAWVEISVEGTGPSSWVEILVLDDAAVAELGLSNEVVAAVKRSGSVAALQIARWEGEAIAHDSLAESVWISSSGVVTADLDRVVVGVDGQGTAGQLVRLGLGHVISAETARSASLPTIETGTLLMAEGPFNEAEIANLGLAGAGLPRSVSVNDSDSAPVSARGQLTALAIVVVVVALVYRLLAGLIAVDTDDAISIMLALGAPKRLRRTHLAGHAFVHLLLAVLLVIPVGLFVAEIVDESGVFFNPFVMPWALLVGLMLLPVAGAGVVALTSSGGVPAVSRRLT